MLLFHGTTLNRLFEIMKDGFLGTEKTVWNCSEENTTYFYSEDFIKEEHDITSEDREQIKTLGIQQALGNADITLALETKNLKRVVLVFDSEDLEKFGKLEKDNSCGQNMEYCLKFSGKIPLDLAKELWIDKTDLDLLALYFKGFAYSRNEQQTEYQLNLDDSLDSEIIECAKIAYEKLSEYFYDNLESVDCLEETSIEKLKEGLKA